MMMTATTMAAIKLVGCLLFEFFFAACWHCHLCKWSRYFQLASIILYSLCPSIFFLMN